MPPRLRYADAVKLLGGSSPAVQAVDNVLGSALTIATGGGSDAALGLFDAKAEVVRLGHVVAGKINDTVRGAGRHDRNQRLQAAHGILVVTSFFEAFDALVRPTELSGPELTRDDEIMLAAGTRVEGDWLHRLLAAPVPVPSAERSYRRLLRDLSDWFADAAARFLGYLQGLAVWERADGRTRAEVLRLVTTRLPETALAGYEQVHRRLAVDVPEFAVWLQRTESQAVGHGLESLEATLRRVTSGRDPDRHRAALAAAYRADLDRPILGSDVGDLGLPRLGEAYVDPIFRAQEAGAHAQPADEDWWAAEPRTDLAAFLTMYLTTPRAAAAPMLLLGQPGAGKSSLVRILAARLPAADFLVVRVVLREVPGEAEIQDQIEHALRAAIGETVAWADLARSAAGALPVVLLDGFDEMLQATGVHQSDYLKRVSAFQHREAVQGRPVAVIVTSRVAVADRAPLPADALAVRLEPFDRAQVARWLATWNAVTGAALPLDVVWRFPDLSAQPLLLLMLALHDAGTGALRDAGSSLGTTDLYERLVGDFARREVRRMHAPRPDPEVADLVETELTRLSIVAFGMFNRSRQWVTEAEVDGDLTALGLPADRPAPEAPFRSPLTPGQQVVGRFFFIQRAQALQQGTLRQTYEFLHATFGEYLVARLLAGLLRQPSDGGWLESLLGFVPLTARGTVLTFTADLLAADRADIRARLVDRLRTAVLEPAYAPGTYRPAGKRADQWMATYSLNLLLLTLACGEPLRATEVFQRAKDPAAWLRGTVQIWRSAVPSGMWLDAVATMTVRRTWTGGRRDLVLYPGGAGGAEPVDPLWSHNRPDAKPGTGFSSSTGVVPALRSMHLSDHRSQDMLRHAVQPVLDRMPETLTHFTVHGPGDAGSVAHGLLSLWLTSMLDEDTEALVRAYDRAVSAIAAPNRWSDETEVDSVVATFTIVFRSLARDAPRLPPADVVRWLTALTRRTAFLRDRHVPDVLASLEQLPDAPELRGTFQAWAERLRADGGDQSGAGEAG